VDRQTIHVNKPLRYKGVTFYQADWGIAGIRFRLNNSPVLELPMGLLNTGGAGRLWGTWLPTKPDLSEGLSVIAKDLQGTLLLYDMQGRLVSTVRSGMSTEINGVTLSIVDVIGSTGLQIKADPGIPIVYTGFALLMVGVMMSYISHSQIWALQTQDGFYIGGKTNRAQVAFEREMLAILEQLDQQMAASSPSSLEQSLA
ncbi:MAG: cytochrome c biogenesis protein ResB, partial [Synechococcales cyanobacterium M58_A2018_015]|nr:cytochrome c biogenesis protein ResB [Synechococcales cyanobacterium M58_A2018_015]